jgi:hypothetical protein
MDYLVAAIKNLRPEAEFSFTDNDYSTIKWDVLDGDAPTAKAIEDEIKRIEAKEAAKPQAKAALLERLGITAEEAELLLG